VVSSCPSNRRTTSWKPIKHIKSCHKLPRHFLKNDKTHNIMLQTAAPLPENQQNTSYHVTINNKRHLNRRTTSWKPIEHIIPCDN
jgi:hypothetical protein